MSILDFFRRSNSENDLTADEFAAQLASTPGAVLLDVRTDAEFRGGHLRGARLADISGPAFQKAVEALEPSTPVFVYCASGSRSAHAARIMTRMGFATVRNLAGGIYSWNGQVVR